MRKTAEPIKNFDDVHRVVKQYLPPMRSSRGAYTLERMIALMDYLGNPQDSYKAIHVAGTSGKTSTCYYVAAMLRQTGSKVGLSISPHVDELNERVQIGLRPLAEKKFCSEFTVFLNLVSKSGITPTYFELLTAFALWEFKRADCEYAVVEVGLGGLLDATNVITRKNKLVVITDIGLDHEEVLGKTVSHITAQKAGIIRPHNVVVMYEQGDEVMNVVREVAESQHTDLHEIWPLKPSELPHKMPLFQRRNWYLALSSFEIVAERDKLLELDEANLAQTTEILIPARMETVSLNHQSVILDGAHNQQKLTALVQSVRNKYPGQKMPVLISLVATKQARILECVEAILPICSNIIITTFMTENQEKFSVDSLKLVDACEQLGFEQWKVIEDPVKAFKALQKKAGNVKLVTGSFYLLNHIRPLLKV